MKRVLFFLFVASLLGVQQLEAQRCRVYRNGRVTVCDRDRDRDRDRHRASRSDRGPIEFGVRGGYDFEEDNGLAGAQLRLPIVRPVAIVPSFDVFFDDADVGDTQWQLNGDLMIRPTGFAGLYGGAGVAFLNADFELTGDAETEVGYNLFAGLEGNWLRETSIRPFVEARWTSVEEYDAFRLNVGFNVPVSRR
jgi:hypothetical protein